MHGPRRAVRVALTTGCGDTWVLDSPGDHVVRCVNVEPLCCALETKVLRVRYTLIFKEKQLGSSLNFPSSATPRGLCLELPLKWVGVFATFHLRLLSDKCWWALCPREGLRRDPCVQRGQGVALAAWPRRGQGQCGHVFLSEGWRHTVLSPHVVLGFRSCDEGRVLVSCVLAFLESPRRRRLLQWGAALPPPAAAGALASCAGTRSPHSRAHPAFLCEAQLAPSLRGGSGQSGVVLAGSLAPCVWPLRGLSPRALPGDVVPGQLWLPLRPSAATPGARHCRAAGRERALDGEILAKFIQQTPSTWCVPGTVLSTGDSHSKQNCRP